MRQFQESGVSIGKFGYQDNKNALEASYCVSYHITKASEAHTIAEPFLNVMREVKKDS